MNLRAHCTRDTHRKSGPQDWPLRVRSRPEHRLTASVTMREWQEKHHQPRGWLGRRK